MPSRRFLLPSTILLAVSLAGCGPGWEQIDETDRRAVHLGPLEVAEGRMSASAAGGRPLKVDVEVEGLVGPNGRIAVDVSDSRRSCSRVVTYSNDGGVWRSSRPDERADADRISVVDVCASPEQRGTVTVRFKNDTLETLDFVWFGRARIGGNNAEPPEGAFVQIDLLD